jgi:hypothetical protein
MLLLLLVPVQIQENDSPELSLRGAQQVVARSREATLRSGQLSPPGTLPRNARTIFHYTLAGGQGVAHPGCLLEQLKRWGW